MPRTRYKQDWRRLRETDLVIDDVRDNVDDILFREAIQNQIKTLNEREQVVLYERFWLKSSLAETGRKLKRSPERIRQIESKALRKLRRHDRTEIIIMASPEWLKVAYDKWQKERFIQREKDRKDAEERRIQWEKEYQERRARQRTLNNYARENLSAVAATFSVFYQPVYQPPKQEQRKASKRCPEVVKLSFIGTEPYLYSSNPAYDIKRERDPMAYDRWLNQRLAEFELAIP